jgi:hypothetical protein
LRALRDVSPGWVGASTLRQLVDYTPPQFAGFVGAFGRRVTYTKNMRENVSLFFDAR